MLALLAITACNAETPEPVTDTPPAQASASATLSTSPTPSPSTTPEPPTATPTFAPVDGLVAWDVNVRSGPSKNFAVLGFVDRFQHVQIVGRDVLGEWYQILFTSGPEGLGWVNAELIEVEDAEAIPIIGLDIGSGTPFLTARVTQRLNVRSGPGFDYMVYGVLEPPTVAVLTGKNELGTWLQVVFADGPGGRGWINVGFIVLEDVDMSTLPILDAAGTPMPLVTGSPTPAPATPTATVHPALMDGDSPDAPGVQVTFSPLGKRLLAYTSDLSSPDGDSDDWIEFTPYASQTGQRARISASLACTGNGTLIVQLQQSDMPITSWSGLHCGDSQVTVELAAGQPAQFHLTPAEGDGLQYVLFTLSVQNVP